MAWRRLTTPTTLRVFVAEAWHDAVADAYDDDTGEVRVRWPPYALDVSPQGAPTGMFPAHHHITLERFRYQPPDGFPGDLA